MSPCRLVSSLKQNLTYYLSIAVAGLIGIGLLLISGSLHAGDLIPLAMLLSNTYGEPGSNDCSAIEGVYYTDNLDTSSDGHAMHSCQDLFVDNRSGGCHAAARIRLGAHPSQYAA